MQTTIQCSHCLHIRPETEKYCPLCRRKPSDKSGHHPQKPREQRIIPIVFSPVGKKAFVTINRGQGQTDSFFGTVKKNFGSHLGIMTVDNEERSVEFFSVQSDKTTITIK